MTSTEKDMCSKEWIYRKDTVRRGIMSQSLGAPYYREKKNPVDLFSLSLHELCDFTVKYTMSQVEFDAASP